MLSCFETEKGSDLSGPCAPNGHGTIERLLPTLVNSISALALGLAGIAFFGTEACTGDVGFDG